jgi:hypothetical protein
MQNITSTVQLKEAIRLLQEQQTYQGLVLKEEFFTVIESIKPVNVIKNTFSQVASSHDLIGNIFSTTVGLAAGYISNKTLVGSSANLLRKLFGTLLQFGITTLVARNPDAVKSLGHTLLHRMLNKKTADS